MMEDEDQNIIEVVPKKRNARKIIWSIIFSIFGIVMVAFFGFFIRFQFRYDVRTVVGWSMLPTFNTNTTLENQGGDIVYINTKAKIKQGDIVVAYSNKLKEYIIKRCIALGGQEVNIIGEEKIDTALYGEDAITINIYKRYYVVVDGEKLKEDYILNKDSLTTMESEFRHFCYYKYEQGYADYESAISLKDGEYFILGDNRGNSTDSSSIGPLQKNEMIGRVDFTIKYGTSSWREYLQKLSFLFIIKK